MPVLRQASVSLTIPDAAGGGTTFSSSNYADVSQIIGPTNLVLHLIVGTVGGGTLDEVSVYGSTTAPTAITDMTPLGITATNAGSGYTSGANIILPITYSVRYLALFFTLSAGSATTSNVTADLWYTQQGQITVTDF